LPLLFFLEITGEICFIDVCYFCILDGNRIMEEPTKSNFITSMTWWRAADSDTIDRRCRLAGMLAMKTGWEEAG
jgi:hypothetical protein